MDASGNDPQQQSPKPGPDEEQNRRADSCLRCIRENPGRSAEELGRLMGSLPAREVRDRIRRARDRGAHIVIGAGGVGYLDLEQVEDEKLRADLVKAHRQRSRSYLIDHATLMRQIGRMTATSAAQAVLFDLLVPDAAEGEPDTGRPATMKDLARLPMPRRAGVVRLLVSLLQGIAEDPEAYAYERAYLADRFGRVFITRREAEKIAQAKRLLEDVGV